MYLSFFDEMFTSPKDRAKSIIMKATKYRLPIVFSMDAIKSYEPCKRCRTDFADIQNKKECGGNRQWQNHYLRNWAANTKGKGII